MLNVLNFWYVHVVQFYEKSLVWHKCWNGKYFLIPQCGNYRNSLSHFFRKNFVKAMDLLKKLLKSWFDELFLWFCWKIINFPNFHFTVWKNEKFSLTKKIFRQINSLVLVTYLVKPLLSRNFCQKCMRVNFRNFHTVKVRFCSST